MAANGDDPTKVTDASWDRAIKVVKKAVDSGQVRQFTGNDYSGPLAKGDLKAAVAWSGDVVQLQADNKHLHWNLPKEGGGIWTDNMLIPKGGNVYTASVYMNYVYDPKIAAAIEDYVNTSARSWVRRQSEAGPLDREEHPVSRRARCSTTHTTSTQQR
jgi:spermidine/putrescine transport system substrate-binding protein